MPESRRPSRSSESPETGSVDPEGTEEPRPSAAARLRAAFLSPSRAQIVVGVLLAGLGFAAVTQVRANDLDDTYAGKRQQDLIDLLSSLSSASQRAQREIAGLEQTRDDLESATTRREAALTAAQQAADNLEVLAGTVPVQGPGIRVTITETDGPIGLNHMLDTVQELRTAQAEAMEFNDQVRAVAQTSFSESVVGIEVDGQELEPPYVIEVIGDPQTLEEGLRFPDGPLQQLRDDDGATVEIEQLDRVEIESVVRPQEPDFAQPDQEQ